MALSFPLAVLLGAVEDDFIAGFEGVRLVPWNTTQDS
jgi:hypothetical protein